MSRKYALSRVRDALEKSEGNHLKAQRLLLSWLAGDHSLLVGLAEPHLQGIIAHALAHAATPVKAASVPAAPLDDFGAALLRGVKADEAPAFGALQARGVPKPGKASSRHVDAITRIARPQDKKSKD